MRSPIARLPKLRPGHAATEPHSKDMLTTGCNEAFRGWLDRSDRLFPTLSSCRALRSRFVDEGERAQIPSRLGEDFSSARQSRIYACNPLLSPPCEAVVVHGAGSIYARRF